jgi:hypothetical protein
MRASLTLKQRKVVNKEEIEELESWGKVGWHREGEGVAAINLLAQLFTLEIIFYLFFNFIFLKLLT